MSVTIMLHLLSAVVWVGGMFFAYMVLRPAAAALLEPPQRLPLWVACFGGFFVWVWVAVVLLPATGYWMMFAHFGGMAYAPLYVHLMNAIGTLMIALYVWLYFVPYRRLKAAVQAGDWKSGGAHLNIIRRIVGTNLLLGLLTITIASAGRYLV